MLKGDTFPFCKKHIRPFFGQQKRGQNRLPLIYNMLYRKMSGFLKIGRLIPFTLHAGRALERIQLTVQSLES